MTDDEDLEAFGKELADIQTDEALGWAEVEHAQPVPREKFHTGMTPDEDGASDPGLQITYRLASDRLVNEWYEMPDEWNQMRYDLVLLLDYWAIEPSNIGRLNSDETFELPFRYDHADEQWEPDWMTIATEAEKDDD